MNEVLPQPLIEDFIRRAHDDLPRVKAMLQEHPALLYSETADGEETPIGAAAHSGNREIVDYLLEAGAPLDICTAAMMGWRERVAEFLAQDPTLANAHGAHRITPIYFAALSGDVTIAQLIMEYGGGDGLKYPLSQRNPPYIHGAVIPGHVEMTRWFLTQEIDLTLRDYRDRTALEAAVELGYEEIAELLRDAIGLENLPLCPQCGQRGYRVVAHLAGNRWADHTTYYQCQRCGVEMEAVARNC